jgi:DNA-binding transcriptional LysR family regulator
MMDRFDAMTVFLTAAELGSLSAAGRRLGMPLSTVSRKISDLETHLRSRLLIRSTRKLALTDSGSAYIVACQRILDEVAAAERGAAGEYDRPRGELIITAPIVFGRLHVLPVTVEFLAAYPDVAVRLTLSDRTLDLLDDHIDLAVRIGELPSSGLKAARIGQVRHVVCASPGYFATRAVPKHPTDIDALDLVTFDAPMGAGAWNFRWDGARRAVAVRSRLVVNTAEAAIDAAMAGVGMTRVLSYQVDAAVNAGKLIIVLKKFELEAIPIHLVFMQGPILPLKLRAYLDFAAPRLRSRVQSLADRKPRRGSKR